MPDPVGRQAGRTVTRACCRLERALRRRTFAVDYGDVDFAALARVLGCFGERVTILRRFCPRSSARWRAAPGGRRRPDRQGQPRRGGAQGLGRARRRPEIICLKWPCMRAASGLIPVKCSKASDRCHTAIPPPSSVRQPSLRAARGARSLQRHVHDLSDHISLRSMTGRTEDPGARACRSAGVDHAVGPPESDATRRRRRAGARKSLRHSE